MSVDFWPRIRGSSGPLLLGCREAACPDCFHVDWLLNLAVNGGCEPSQPAMDTLQWPRPSGKEASGDCVWPRRVFAVGS